MTAAFLFTGICSRQISVEMVQKSTTSMSMPVDSTAAQRLNYGSMSASS